MEIIYTRQGIGEQSRSWSSRGRSTARGGIYGWGLAAWAASRAATRPSMVCCLASMAGFKPSAARALEVSGPMVAVLSCGNLLQQGGQIEPRVKMLHGRAAGEGHPIRALGQQAGGGPGRIFGFGHGLVAGHVIHNGAQGFERLGQFPDSPPPRAAGRSSGSQCSRTWRRPWRSPRPAPRRASGPPAGAVP